MKKIKKYSKAWNYWAIRKIYQEKRHSSKWRIRKKNKKIAKKRQKEISDKHKKAPFKDHKAPNNFSFIYNTNEVLRYFNDAKNHFKQKNNVTFDISEVTEMTPDTIGLLVANINDPKFIKTGSSRGNAPNNPKLNKIFTESGFGEYVSGSGGFKRSQPGNFLHKEVNQKVVPQLAKNVCILGLNHVFSKSKPFPPLYEILIECMSNTHNHASLKQQGECRWWLYVYNNPETQSTSYTFIDLGVGIFKSAHIDGYVKKILRKTGITSNLELVDDLLEGKIHSRIEKDRDIRGRGIPQIVNHSKNPFFREFYIITNNVKINLTNGDSVLLEENFSGTFLHWELTQNNHGN